MVKWWLNDKIDLTLYLDKTWLRQILEVKHWSWINTILGFIVICYNIVTGSHSYHGYSRCTCIIGGLDWFMVFNANNISVIWLYFRDMFTDHSYNIILDFI